MGANSHFHEGIAGEGGGCSRDDGEISGWCFVDISFDYQLLVPSTFDYTVDANAKGSDTDN